MVIDENREAFELLMASLDYSTFISCTITENQDKYVNAEYVIDDDYIIKTKLTKIAMEDIKKLLIMSENLDLDMCYIDKFNAQVLSEEEKSILSKKEFSSKFAYYFNGSNFSNLQFGAEKVSFLGGTFNGDVLFKETHFGCSDVSFVCTKFECSEINFQNTKFDKVKINFEGAHFFAKNICFNKAMFCGTSLSFISTHFNNGNISFNHTKFDDGYINFKYAKFNNFIITFNHSEFADTPIYFIETIFDKGTFISLSFKNFSNDKLSFEYAILKKATVMFLNTSFTKAQVTFDNAQFDNSKLNFENLYFCKGNISFNKAMLNATSPSFTKGEVKDSDFSFDDTVINNAEMKFIDVIAPKTRIKFNTCKLLNYDIFGFTELNKLEFLNCILDGTLSISCTQNLSLAGTKNLGSVFIDWDTAKNAIAKYGDNLKDRELNKQKADQMKMLKENYHNLGEYEWEDGAFVEYMRYMRKSKHILTRFPSWIIDTMAGYGTKPFRLFVTMIIVIILFGVLFSGYLPFIELGGKEDFGLFRGLYFSIITFLTIGYGDISPLNTTTAFLAGLEGFLGLFLMSYFTVSIVRKTLR